MQNDNIYIMSVPQKYAVIQCAILYSHKNLQILNALQVLLILFASSYLRM